MIISGPSSATVAPANTPAPVAQPTIYTVFLDMVQHTYVISYGGPLGPSRTVSGTIPGNKLANLQALAQLAVEVDQGWIQGSSSLVTP